MKYLLRGAMVYSDTGFVKRDVYVSDGKIAGQGGAFPDFDGEVFDFTDKYIFPGFSDVHVHLREPGFSYKETIASGTAAAARGGYTNVCSMPNLSPCPDCAKSLRSQLDIIERDAAVRVFPFGAITRGEEGKQLSDMKALAPDVIGFSDDGRGVADAKIMLDAMKKAKSLGKIISAHCEDMTLRGGGYIHGGGYCAAHGHIGISSESEYKPIERDIALVEKSGCDYHVCHISTRESAELIRRAKGEGLPISCETAPHYLLLDEGDMREDGAYKMNPPLRTYDDRAALIEGLLDGTIDMIATDHAPHSPEEKSRGLENSAMGITGLECAFPVLYTQLVLREIISLEKLIYLLAIAPRVRFGLPGGLSPGDDADFTVFDLEKEYTLNPEEFLSKGKSTPFAGKKVLGECLMTAVGGKIAWKKQ